MLHIEREVILKALIARVGGLVLIGSAACMSPFEPVVAFQRIDELSTAQTQFRSPMFDVVRSDADWTSTWQDAGLSPPARRADFTRSIIVVAAVGPRPSGGYTVEITEVRASDDGLQVVVRVTSPGPECRTPDEPTSPADAVIVDRLDSDVEFSISEVVHRCN